MIKCFVVDAFTNKLFSGNPAAICLLEKAWLDDDLMQKIAKEHRLSETAFILKDEGNYHLRWLTPKQEISLCGHATLASAFVVMNFINTKANSVSFHTKSGILTVQKKDKLYQMNFPAFELKRVEVSKKISEAVGQDIYEAYLGRDLICLLKDENAVRKARVDLKKLENLEGELLHISTRGDEFDCVSRSFAVKHGVDEDPVCGSGHCHLVPLWAKKLGKNEILAFQASERGGVLKCRLDKDRVWLSGEAVLFSKNEIML